MKRGLMRNNKSTLPGLMSQFLCCSEDHKEKSCKRGRKSVTLRDSNTTGNSMLCPHFVSQATPFAERRWVWSHCNKQVVAMAETCCDQ